MKIGNSGYYDSIGGFHDSGVGWSPDKSYCGECNRSTCKTCPLWVWKQRYKHIERRDRVTKLRNSTL